MFARELISAAIPPIHPLDTAARVLHLMNEFHVAQLPLVNEEEYIGLINEEELLDLDNPDTFLQPADYLHFKPAVQEMSHFFEALKLSSEYKLSVVPVITHDDQYCGVITQENLIHAVAQYSTVNEPGGLLLLEMSARDYALSEIARIAESNDVNILGINTYRGSDGKWEVLLKANRQDLQSLVATFERFNYTVAYLFSDKPEEDSLSKNYDMLMNYINM